MLPLTWPLLKILWAIDPHAMPILRAMIAAQRDVKKIFHIRTLTELRTFYCAVEHHAKAA